MKTIVVPTDFSPLALNAAKYATKFALSINASVSLLHIYQVPILFMQSPVPGTNLGGISKDAKIKMAAFHKKLLQTTDEQIKIYTEVRMGSMIPELRIYCKEVSPYAVVMGTHSTGALKRLFLSSHTIAAINQLAWPLIVVPAEASFKPIRNIGFACDFKQFMDTSPVEEIRSLVKDLNAGLHVLFINKDYTEEYDSDFIEETESLQEMIGDLNPIYHFVNHPDIDEGLFAYADKYLLDMLIVVHRRHKLMDKIFYYSHTRQLALHTHIPLVAMHE